MPTKVICENCSLPVGYDYGGIQLCELCGMWLGNCCIDDHDQNCILEVENDKADGDGVGSRNED